MKFTAVSNSLELGLFFFKCLKHGGPPFRWNSAPLVQRRPAVFKSWPCIGRLLWMATLRISPSTSCRWFASNGRHFFSPTVRFIGLPMNPDVFGQAMPSTLTFVSPYAKRSRMATVYAVPFTHMAGFIGSKCVGSPPMEPF